MNKKEVSDKAEGLMKKMYFIMQIFLGVIILFNLRFMLITYGTEYFSYAFGSTFGIALFGIAMLRGYKTLEKHILALNILRKRDDKNA